MTFSFFACPTHPIGGWYRFSVTVQVGLQFLLPPQEVTFKSHCKGHPVRGKEMPIKKLLISRNPTCLLWICAQAPQQRKNLTLSTTLCHSYTKLQHGAPHLSSPLGLCSRNTRSVQRIIDFQDKTSDMLSEVKINNSTSVSFLRSSKANTGALQRVVVCRAQCENLIWLPVNPSLNR